MNPRKHKMRHKLLVRSCLILMTLLSSAAVFALQQGTAGSTVMQTLPTDPGSDSLPMLGQVDLEDDSGRLRQRAPRRPGQRPPAQGPVTGTSSGRVQEVRPRDEVVPRGGAWQARRWQGKEQGLPPVDYSSLDQLPPVPDRWRIVDSLGYPKNLWDPYSGNNVLKADRPAFGKNWFFNLGVTSDTVVNARHIPVPVGTATTTRANSLDTLGNGDQLLFSENLIVETVLLQGDTVFRPPDYEFRFTPVFNYNYLKTEERGLVKVDPTDSGNNGKTRSEAFVGIQSLFVDKHLRNVSDRYDFDSLRIGIQPITADFRGFLFLDQPFGVRLFGTRNNNVFQYNLGWFRRLDKDINSGLNDVTRSWRDDDVFLANLYWQDMPKRGFTSQATVIYNRNREKNKIDYDRNGIIARPGSLLEERGRNYDVTYLGYSGDGHLGRVNLTTSLYYAAGRETNTRIPDATNDISAWFGAAEASVDMDWIRLRLSGLYGSGDDNPFDGDSQGFDAIFENPQFAGADTSYYISQSIPLIGGGGVSLSGRNAVLNSLRSSKEEGQSNFTNPGIRLLGVGADLDLVTQLRLSFNANQLWFDETAALEVLRQQASIDRDIGTDLSVAMIYRPLFTQNIVFRLSGAVLLPGDGFKALYGDDDTQYSVLGNLILNY
jgi:hypothetical protein